MTLQFNPDQWFGVVLCLLPAALALTFIIRKRSEQRDSKRVPFTELVRRPAGETIRLELEELDEKLNESTTFFLLVPIAMAGLLFVVHPFVWLTPIICFLITAGSSSFFGRRLYKDSESRAKYRLGYDGERFVGEELTRLIAAGFEIYHDVPFDNFNMDHVLVGRRGVFVVETKAWRKPLSKPDNDKPKVVLDGEVLRIPGGSNKSAVNQAKNNAKTLATWLSSATGGSVWVTPILTFPGWWVEQNAPRSDIYVMNPEQIFWLCSKEPESLAETQIKSICYQLDQKCRVKVT
jgi:hypothetical protein